MMVMQPFFLYRLLSCVSCRHVLCILPACILMLMDCKAYAMHAPDKESDSARVRQYHMPQILRIAPGPEQNAAGLPLRSAGVIDSKAAGLLPSRRLDAIYALQPGLDLRDYGGPGSLRMLSTRGLGAQRTVIRIEGIPMNTPQNGMADAGSLPLFPGDEIQIYRGGASVLAGSGAMGGVIDLHNGSALHDAMFYSAGLGSFGELLVKGSALWADSLHKRGAGLAADYLQYKGDFPFLARPPGAVAEQEFRRSNGAASIFTAIARGNMYTKSQDKLSAWALFRNNDRGVPGAVLSGRPEISTAVYTEKEIIGAIGYTVNAGTLPRINSGLTARYSHVQYNDPESRANGGRGIFSNYFMREISGFAGINTIERNSSIFLSAKVEGGFTSLNGDMLQPEAGNNPWRALMAFSGIAYWEYESFRVEAGGRADFFSGNTGKAFSPSLSLGYLLTTDILLHLRLSRDFRAPSFNEMYYLNFGTSSLKPEVSFTTEAGIGWRTSNISAGLDIYSISVQDQILAVPVTPVQWSARNIGSVLSQGVELYLITNILNALELRTNITWQSVTDQTDNPFTRGRQLPYTPQWHGSAALSWEIPPFRLGMISTLYGQRFALPDQSKGSEMPAFSLISTFIVYYFKINEINNEIRADFRNLFNEQYQMIANYPLPGFSFIISISFLM